MKTINLTTDEEITLKLTIEEKIQGNLSRMDDIYKKISELSNDDDNEIMKDFLIDYYKDLHKEAEELDRILSYLK